MQQKVNLVEEMRLMHLVSAVLEKIASGKDESEVLTAVSKLNEKFRSCETVLNMLPAGDLTHADQVELLKSLQERLAKTRELIEKYKNLEIFRTPGQNGIAPMET
mmetsp:Transcript_2384/g.7126  ORF Transcript_2384/g.7126 Transcript_2384/m.7126 type:complete len:105 (+) Transcript_2384:108-422(+)